MCKYKDCKTGEIFQSMKEAHTDYCQKRHSDCSNCPLSITNNPKIMYCYTFVIQYPEEAERIMGISSIAN